MAVQNPPTWLQNASGGYDAQDDRMVIRSLVVASGVTDHDAMIVAQTSTASMGVTVAAGTAFIVGVQSAYQGTYHVVNDAPMTVAIGPANSTNPRIDAIVLRVNDAQYSGSANNAEIVAVPGTPASVPVAPVISGNAILLAYVRVNANVSSILQSNLTEMRPVARLNDLMTNVPAGTVSAFAGTAGFIPAGWVYCGGQAISRTAHKRLWYTIGTTYGAGDGATTFNVPDLRARAPFGYDGALAFGAYGGAKTHTLTVNEIAPHTHTQDPHTHSTVDHAHWQNVSANPGSGGTSQRIDYNADGAGGHPYAQGIATDPGSVIVLHTAATNQNAGGGAPHNNMPPFVVMNYMIKT